MKIQRKFTEAGKDVFSSVEWTTRSSRIVNPDGSVVFEMADAEVPKRWSQLATDIMVSKYFRKAGVPQAPEGMDPLEAQRRGEFQTDDAGAVVTGPERSVKQVVHRLAGCWRQWGERHGYFDTEEDAQAFYDELAWMLLTQMAAPNSPQWFNTGLAFAYGMSGPAQGHWYTDPATGQVRQAEDAYTHPQPHACFIQSISDDLVNDGGIMDLWVREARLFKYGSGTGTNFSNLRAENEPLSGGGKSSGLMSFLKIGDRAAGAIKSGGTTRRAAKMVCLDLDHPDIEHFVNWKVREELKVAAMAEGIKRLPGAQQETAEKLGLELNYDFNGEAYATVSGQNSNNSVRIPNAFFHRLDEDGPWELKRRTDGEAARSVPARELWEQIGFAAWRCADPGVQFDSTINEWHTCPESGRINASNPCVTGDTLVATTTGHRRIADLVGESAEIIDGEGHAAYVDRIFKTGHKPIFELKTRSGYTLRLTADHPVYTLNRGDVAASDLTVDDVVQLRGAGFGDAFVPEAFGELLGAALGDGCLTKSENQEFLFVSLSESERGLAERLAGNIQECKQWLNVGDHRGLRPTEVTSTSTGLRVGSSVARLLKEVRRYAVLDAGAEGKRLTDEVFSLDRRSQAALLRGLFTTDGTVADYGEKSQYVSLDSTSREMLQQVQVLLLSFGIKSKLYENRRALGQSQAMMPDGRGGRREYPVQQIHSLRISRRSRVVFEEAIGFIEGTEKARRLSDLNRRVETYRDELVDRIASLRPCGKEDVYDLTEPKTNHFVANGLVVHNCSEYMFLDNTACNLASINLMTLYRPADKSFDLEGFEHAIRLWTVVLEISVLMAAFPSKEIARLSYEYRTLGLGFANLGAMLMQAGIPYDSDTGRAIAGAISATMTGRSYATSAEMAAEHGPFAGFFKNREPMLRVMRNHRRAAYGVTRDPQADAGEFGHYEALEIAPVPIEAEHLECEPQAFGQLSNSKALLEHARSAWDEALQLGEQHGYRNAQTTVIAPTGTIGLLMDCDTTGVEPDFSLVKFKKLAGGGYFKIANQSLRPALTALGYDERQVREIMAHVMGVQTLDVPMPNLEGEISEDNPTFKDYLKHKGVGDEELGRLTDTLGSAMELSFAFNAFVLGEDTVKRMGLDPAGDLLKQLGLNRKQIDVLNELITGTGTVEGSPHMKDEHLPVFDCANKCGRTGQRFIAPQGHIRMMAAVQPFISGAISKTINLPNEADVAAIKACYRLSWELGLKANALYRDGSKLSQVLNATSDEAAAIDAEVEDEEAIEAAKKEVTAEASATADRIASAATEADAEQIRQPVEKIVERIVERPLRRRLPNTRRSLTHKFNVAGHEGYLTVGLYEDGQPGELFITMAKEGSTIGGLMDTLGTAISVSLQYGVPVESLVNKFTHARFEPAGMTDNREIPFAKSLVDYIFRWMGMEFVPGYREANAPKRPSDAGKGGGKKAVSDQPAGQASTPKSSDRTDSVPDDRAGATHGSGAPARLSKSQAEGNGGRLAELHEAEEARVVAIDDPELAAEHQRRHGPLNDLQKGGSAAMAAAERQNAKAAALASTLNEANSQMMGDAPACDVCGSITVRNGTCYKCLNCGNSMGCS